MKRKSKAQQRKEELHRRKDAMYHQRDVSHHQDAPEFSDRLHLSSEAVEQFQEQIASAAKLPTNLEANMAMLQAVADLIRSGLDRELDLSEDSMAYLEKVMQAPPIIDDDGLSVTDEDYDEDWDEDYDEDLDEDFNEGLDEPNPSISLAEQMRSDAKKRRARRRHDAHPNADLPEGQD